MRRAARIAVPRVWYVDRFRTAGMGRLRDLGRGYFHRRYTILFYVLVLR
jgi:hypothetical protein